MAILQASVFGMTGMMPGKYTAASMTGMGLSGIGAVRFYRSHCCQTSQLSRRERQSGQVPHHPPSFC